MVNWLLPVLAELHQASGCLLCREAGGELMQETAADAEQDVPATQLKDRSRSSSRSSGTRSRSRSPAQMPDKGQRDDRSRSGSSSSSSRSRSRSTSRSRSRSNERRSRSSERRSKSPSEEVKRASGDYVVESTAAKFGSELPTKPVSEEFDEPQHSSSDEDDSHQQSETTKEVCMPVCVNCSQQ